MTDKQLIEKILSLLEANYDKIDLIDGDNKLLSLTLFKPVKKENLHDYIYAYEIFVELAISRVIVQIIEKIFNGRDMTGKSWPVNDTPVDLVVLCDDENYGKFRDIFAAVDANEKLDALKRRDEIVQQFLNDEFTFENPIDSLIKINEEQRNEEKSGGAAMQEPKIMDFSSLLPSANTWLIYTLLLKQ